MLLSQSEPRRDPPIDTEHLLEEFWAIAFLAAMQKYDVIRQLVCAVKKFANGGEGLPVGQMAVTADNTPLEEIGAGTISLHLRVVVGF